MSPALASLLVRARAATVVPCRCAISDRVSPAFTVYVADSVVVVRAAADPPPFVGIVTVVPT